MKTLTEDERHTLIDRNAREYLARNIREHYLMMDPETFSLLLDEINSEPYLTNGDIMKAVKRAESRSPQHKKRVKQMVRSARLPYNS